MLFLSTLTSAVAMVAGLSLGPVPRGAACPGTSPIAGLTAMKPFVPGRFSWFKDEHQLHAINYRQIRPLGNGQNPRDGDVCAAMNAGFRGGVFDQPTTSATYFQADNFYLAVFVDRRDPATTRLWYPQLFVFDKQLRYVAAIVPK